ncbi:hypothetical protein OG539_23690 [Actinacidiphila glaucinigra]|uniref:hypothetical protein n=1 Tax=Actinacidiphila glaucinigra TaxID=235986 RepID=UPI002DD94FE7|nr:hypothetical protein [Actinacidiphila glaucinigra]WSD60898.1 hypothetical protein OIE69_19215 [Actinacidiphila glaucinigra]
MNDETIPPAETEPTTAPAETGNETPAGTVTEGATGTAAETQSGTAPGSENVDEPATAAVPTVEENAPAPRRSRRGLAMGVAAALVAVVAGGGIGFAVLQHQKDDGKQASGQTWKAPEPKETGEYGTQSGGSHYGPLGKLLLPMPDGYSLGPDIAEFGNDAELPAERAEELMRGDLDGVPKKQRDLVRKAVARLHIQGMGMRTYGEDQDRFFAETQIVQMKNKRSARADTEFFTAFTKALGVFRNGPKIAGHAGARCVLPPKEPGQKLDSMVCQATEGDLLIRMSVTGTSPLRKTEAADLFKQQLDRVQDPGEAA